MVYDVSVIGGGLGGLTLAINLAMKGRSVILFEKETYPFQKVCGEYISMESHSYLKSLGLPLQEMSLPFINTLVVTSPAGNKLSSHLPLGGFGISRFKLDNDLKKIAIKSGVTLLEGCKAEDIEFQNELFTITTTKGKFESKVCCGSFGKKSNFDVKWQRGVMNNKTPKYVGVKYHVKASVGNDIISLHNFKDGYCGISKIEEEKYCLCYLTTAKNLKDTGTIQNLEDTILSKNPHLKYLFQNAEKISGPVTISGITFDKKRPVENNVILTGDAAGIITPLCGNGMSMAMHAGKIASEIMNDFLDGKISREQMNDKYEKKWNATFGKRLIAGRMIQRFFGRVWLSEFFIKFMKRSPVLTRSVIRLTHGKEF